MGNVEAVKGPQAPGQERIVSSPVVLGLVACFLVLVAMIAGLFAIIAATAATRAFNQGVQDYDDGDYRTAIRDFDGFLAKNPEDPRIGKARVLRAMANVRQYVSVEGGTWTSALEASQQALEQVGSLEEFRDVRPDLGELIIRIGEGLADRAARRPNPRRSPRPSRRLSCTLRSPASRRWRSSTGQGFRASCPRPGPRYARPGSAPRRSDAMDQALAEGSATRVYDARDSLVAQYADLAHDKDLIARMTAANELIRQAVVDRHEDAAGRHTSRGPTRSGPRRVWSGGRA